jgi:hypothetical protein
MELDTARKQAFAAALAAARKCGAAAFRLHAGAKTVLAFARALAWLICPFHKAAELPRRDLGAMTLGTRKGMSIVRAKSAAEDSGHYSNDAAHSSSPPGKPGISRIATTADF